MRRDSTKIIIWVSFLKWDNCFQTNNLGRLVPYLKESLVLKNKWCRHRPNSQAERWSRQWLGPWVGLLVDLWLDMMKQNYTHWFSNWKLVKIMGTPRTNKSLILLNKTSDLRKKSANLSWTSLHGMLNQPMKTSKSITNNGSRKLEKLSKTTSSRWTTLGSNWWKGCLTRPPVQVNN